METANYQNSGRALGTAAGYPATRDNPMGEPTESVVFRAVTNLQSEINGLSVNIDMLCSRIGAASRPVGKSLDGSADKAIEPATSLLTKKIDDQAKRLRMLSNQVATALEGLEL